MDSKNILKQCAKYAVISFDIFDTLLKRDVLYPSDVFCIVERVYVSRTGKKLNFCTMRKKAEKIAKQKSSYPDITLEEIYTEIEAPIDDKISLMQLELDIESSLLHKNSGMLHVFRQCLEKGKQVYLVSDMYLPRHFLEEILSREGFKGYQNLYLSCEQRAVKKSGELFRIFIEKEHIQPENIFHIGDSWYADVIGPARVGAKGIHIQRNKEKTLYFKRPDNAAELDKRCLYAFINTHIDYMDNRAEQLGYEVLGPIVYAYCQWIHQNASMMPNAKLWFAARDMYLFVKAYELLFGESENYEYIYISRKSLRPVFTQAMHDLTLSGEVFARGKYSIRELIQYMGYDLADIGNMGADIRIDFDAKKYDARKLGSYEEVRAALNSPKIIHSESVLAENGTAYLREHGLFDHDILLADVGWHGTTQHILEKIQMTAGNGRSIHGLYLGCLDGTDEKIGRDSYKAFLFDENSSCMFMNGIILLECFILAPHGSTNCYKKDGDRVLPVLKQEEKISPFILKVQSGILRFINEFKETALFDTVQLSPKTICEPFERLIAFPQKEELESIRKIEYENFYYNKIADPESLIYYLWHPGQLRSDFKYSPWRIGFLYNLFKIRLPYAKFYLILRKILA